MSKRIVSQVKKLLEIRTNILYHVCVQRMMIMKKITQLAIIPILVADQDEALHFYTEKLELEKRADMMLGPGLRWLTVAPKGQKKPEIALAKPDPSLAGIQIQSREKSRANSQYVACVFATDDCCKMYHTLLGRGVTFLCPPTRNVYGTEAIFEDPYGNVFSLLEPSPEAQSVFRNRGIGTAA
jgi:predicted enzyme related to lactoylglutathione lyase